jgi:hypothetical protein
MRQTLLGFIVAAFFVGTAQAVPVVVETVHRPACYERSNEAVPAALARAELQARQKCGNAATLLGVQVKIERHGGCTPVTVVARYFCG